MWLQFKQGTNQISNPPSNHSMIWYYSIINLFILSMEWNILQKRSLNLNNCLHFSSFIFYLSTSPNLETESGTSGRVIAVTPEGFSRGQSKVLNAKSMAELLGPRSSTSTNKGCFRVGGSLHRQTLYEEALPNSVPILRYWLSLKTFNAL